MGSEALIEALYVVVGLRVDDVEIEGRNRNPFKNGSYTSNEDEVDFGLDQAAEKLEKADGRPPPVAWGLIVGFFLGFRSGLATRPR